MSVELPHRRMYAAEACRSRVGWLGWRASIRRRLLCRARLWLRRTPARLVPLRLTAFCRRSAFCLGLTLPSLVR